MAAVVAVSQSNTDLQSCSDVTQADTAIQSWSQKGSWFMDSRLGRASILVDELALRLTCCVILCQVRGSTVMRASSLMYLKEAEMSSARAKTGEHRSDCGVAC